MGNLLTTETVIRRDYEVLSCLQTYCSKLLQFSDFNTPETLVFEEKHFIFLFFDRKAVFDLVAASAPLSSVEPFEPHCISYKQPVENR